MDTPMDAPIRARWLPNSVPMALQWRGYAAYDAHVVLRHLCHFPLDGRYATKLAALRPS